MMAQPYGFNGKALRILVRRLKGVNPAPATCKTFQKSERFFCGVNRNARIYDFKPQKNRWDSHLVLLLS